VVKDFNTKLNYKINITYQANTMHSAVFHCWHLSVWFAEGFSDRFSRLLLANSIFKLTPLTTILSTLDFVITMIQNLPWFYENDFPLFEQS